MAGKRLVLEIDRQLYDELRDMAAKRGVSLEELCAIALRRQVNLDKAIEPDEVLTELWDNEDDAVYDNI